MPLDAASSAGVRVEPLIRGICCLRPGVEGMSENIRVGSIVGRFLEHSRVYRFANGGNDGVYLSSADMMERNLERRVELMFPVDDSQARERLKFEALELPLRDTVKMRWLGPDGVYRRATCPPETVPFNSQEYLIHRE